MTTPSISLASMAMNPFTPSPWAMNGYLQAVRSTLEIVDTVYTPCIADNLEYIASFLKDHGLNYSTDKYGITIYR